MTAYLSYTTFVKMGQIVMTVKRSPSKYLEDVSEEPGMEGVVVFEECVEEEPEYKVLEEPPPVVLIIEQNVYKKKRPPAIRVNMCQVEVSMRFKEALRVSEKTQKSSQDNYYKTYLKHLFGSCKKIHEKMKVIQGFRERVSSRLIAPQHLDKIFVRKILNDNAYFYKSVRSGVVTKLFHTQYNHGDVIIKAYIYDQHCLYVSSMVEENFYDEVTFQLYANTLNDGLDFISPKIYSWGKICRYKYPSTNCWFSCLYIIMEYIPHLTMNQSGTSNQSIKDMYIKVGELNGQLIQNMVHHNDLNRNNIMIEPVSNKIVLIDFGESKMGPTKPLFPNNIC